MSLLTKAVSRLSRGQPQPAEYPNTRNRGGWSGNGWRNLNWFKPNNNSNIDYEAKVGDLMSNSVVAAGVNWIAKNFCEAPAILARKTDDGKFELLKDHPLTKLLQRPNPYYSRNQLWSSTIQSYETDGNAYWLLVWDKLHTTVLEIRYLPHHLVEPNWDPNDRYTFIKDYEYKSDIDAEKLDYIPVDEIVHFRNLHDPKNTRKGMSPLRYSAMREIFTDNEATNFAAQMLENYGTPSMLISPKSDEVILEPKDGDNIRAEFKERVQGDKRGSLMVLSAGVEVEKMGFNPKEMDLINLHMTPEERICSLLNISPIVLNLGSGLKNSTMSNMKDSREAAVENCIIPLQNAFAADIEAQLLPHFEEKPEDFCIVFDLSNVRALQPDWNQLMQVLNTGFSGNILKLNEIRKKLGYAEIDNGDRFFFEIQGENMMKQREHANKLSIEAMASRLESMGPRGQNATNTNRSTSRSLNAGGNSENRSGSENPRNLAAPGSNPARAKKDGGQDEEKEE